MTYRAPFVTETDERFTDCQFCAGLMLLADWTDSEAVHDEHGNTLDASGLKRLRERVRALSGDTEGGASLDDLAAGIARRFPDLPPLPRTTAPRDPLCLSFDELWARLMDGHCAVLDGNPSRVEDPSSPLRSMQADDDYDHAVFVHAAGPEKAFVMDPLGRGAYQGRWVSREDLPRFASAFVTPSGSPYCAVVRRGLGLPRSDGHPASAVNAGKGCPSWGPWSHNNDERAGRTPTRARGRWSSSAARATDRSPRSPVTST